MVTTDIDHVGLTTGFLRDLASGRIEEALAVVDETIVYENVGFPAVRGKELFGRVMRALNGKLIRFDAEILTAAADGPTVLNERIDLLAIGPLRLRFWVCGHFEIADGRIVVWRDYFDFFDCTKAMVRAVVGLAFPGVVKPIRSLTEGR